MAPGGAIKPDDAACSLCTLTGGLECLPANEPQYKALEAHDTNWTASDISKTIYRVPAGMQRAAGRGYDPWRKDGVCRAPRAGDDRSVHEIQRRGTVTHCEMDKAAEGRRRRARRRHGGGQG